MNTAELRKKTPAELREELFKLRREQFNLRMQQGTGQMTRNHEFGRVRKDIARVKTVLNQRLQADNASAD